MGSTARPDRAAVELTTTTVVDGAPVVLSVDEDKALARIDLRTSRPLGPPIRVMDLATGELRLEIPAASTKVTTVELSGRLVAVVGGARARSRSTTSPRRPGSGLRSPATWRRSPHSDGPTG
jgi:hypothetical protein